MTEQDNPHSIKSTMKNTNDRIAHMEERINNHATMVSGFSATLNSYGKQLEAQNESIEKIFDIVSKPHKVNYGWWIAGMGVAVSLTFSFTTMVTNPMKENERKMASYIERLQEKQMDAAHRIGRLETKGDLLDSYIRLNSDRVASLVDNTMELKGVVSELVKGGRDD